MFRQFFAVEGSYCAKTCTPGMCAYCHSNFPKLEKEHVIPKSIGGTYTIRVCKTCNRERADSFTYEPFVKWTRSHIKEFHRAVQIAIQNNPKNKNIILGEIAKIPHP